MFEDKVPYDVMFDVNVRIMLLEHKLGLGYAAQQSVGNPWALS